MDDPSTPRSLGVVEAIQVVCDQCPSGAVRAVAERALEAVRRREGSLRDQALLVLAAIQGWRGDRARQVHAALTDFIARSGPPPCDDEPHTRD